MNLNSKMFILKLAFSNAQISVLEISENKLDSTS